MGLIVLAIKIHPALLQQGLEDMEMLPQMAEGRGELDPHGLDGRTVARANTETETPGCELGDHLRLLHHHQGMARKRRHDGSPQLDVLGADCGSGEDGHTIEPCPACRHPGGVDAELLGLLNHRERLARFVSTDRNANHLLPSCMLAVAASVSCACRASYHTLPLFLREREGSLSWQQRRHAALPQSRKNPLRGQRAVERVEVDARRTPGT